MPLTEEEEIEKEILELEIAIEEQEALENNSLSSSPDATINLQKKPDSDSWLKPPTYEDGWHDQYGFGDEVANAMSFGLSPRVSAAGMTAADVFGDVISGKGVPDLSDTYGRRLDQRFKQRDAYRKKHPYLSTGASVVGAFGNPLSKPLDAWMRGGKFFGTQTPKLTKLGTPKPIGFQKPPTPQFPNTTLKQQIGRGATGGGAWSALQGFNEAQGDLVDRAIAGGKSGGIGTAMGAGMPPVVKGGAYLLQQLAGAIAKIPTTVGIGGRFAPMAEGMQETLAWRKLAEALERDNYKSLDEAAKRLDELGPEATLADLGDNMRNLAYSVYSRPSKGSAQVFQKAESRQKGVFPDDDPAATLQGGQRNRINEKAEELFPERFQGVQNQGEINKLYDSAFKNNPDITSKELDFFLKTETGKKAMKRAIGIMSDSRKLAGTPDPALTQAWREAEEGIATPSGMGISKGFKMETWDYIKEGLDEVIDRLDPVKDKRALKRMTLMKKNFLKELDSLDATGGDYAKARSLSSTNFQNQEAFDLGQKFIRRDVRPDDLAEKLANMGEEQLHNYRIGAIKELRNNIGAMKAGANKAQAILDDETLQRKVKEVFGDEQKFGEYMTLLKNEAEMAKLRTRLGGSPTGKNIEATADLDIDPKAIAGGLMKMKAGSVPAIVSGGLDILRSLGNRAFMREKTADTLGKALTGRDLSGVTRKYTPKMATPKSRSNLASKFTIGASPLIGRKRKPDIVLRKSILDAR
tara:strand:- start:299 stop:2548 length:2250 start_codon:yes stop_codon:yes gene_type:complete